MLAAFFLAGIAGCRLIQTLPYMVTGNWKDLGTVYRAMEDRADSVAALYALYQDQSTLLELEAAGEDVEYRLGRVDRQIQEAEQALRPESTWFRFRVSDIYGGQLDTNLEYWDALEDEVDLVHQAVFTPGHYYVEHDGEAWLTWSNGQTAPQQELAASPDMAESEDAQAQPPLVIEYGVAREVTGGASDEFTQIAEEWNWAHLMFPSRAKAVAVWLTAGLLCLLYLLWASGHRAGKEGIVPTWQEKVFLELYLAAAAGVIFLILWGILDLGDLYLGYYFHDWAPLDGDFSVPLTEYALAALFALGMGTGALVLRTVVVRVKAGTFLATTLLYKVVKWMARAIHVLLRAIGYFIQNIPLFWRAALVCGGYILSTFVFFLWRFYHFGLLVFLWGVASLAVFLLVCWWAIGFQALRRASRSLAAGELKSHIETKQLPPGLRACAEDLNNLSVGLQTAVNEQMKSERFKAELITNVSHDLKTPLTSIINYVDLLKNTEQTDQKAVEYIEVLDRKAQRLKKLTEDLVEASKASTGALTVNREKLGMVQLLDQALGEYAEKLEAQDLTVIRTMPEEEAYVYADGRHLWRVVDNLLGNCCKYALTGTRVYLELKRGKGQVILSVKNISREPLNVPAEQLMERFVRGDASRTTEGSGLGLSIARSLTELQGGIFELAVDGDLFKVTVTMPQAG